MLQTRSQKPYDLIVVGGSLSGCATALICKRKNPGLRILIVERKPHHSRRVGESTVEISSYFLGKTLGLTDYLVSEHISKQGLRFWFYDDHSKDFDSCSEIGPLYNVRLPSFQVDRSTLDEHLLSECEAIGIEILRPAEVKQVELNEGGIQRLEIKTGEAHENLASRWLVDASGMAKKIAKQENWIVKNTEHPIGSTWGRWKGVKSWDAKEIRDKFPDFAQRSFSLRNSATNHLIGNGWWSWWIPLKGGDVSIGIVYDERITKVPEGANISERLRKMLFQHPIAKILIEDAEPIEKDLHWRKNFSYHSKKIIGNGFALVGDAAAFIDPFYSPGMDWIGFTSYSAATLIDKEFRGELDRKEIETQDKLLRLSYKNWFEAIYKDKYYYMGDYELMKIAFNLDLSLYYLGVVSQPFKLGDDSFLKPPLAGKQTRLPCWLIKTYNRRLASIAKKRKKQGRWGKMNSNHYYPFISFGLDNKLRFQALKYIIQWWILEIKEFFIR